MGKNKNYFKETNEVNEKNCFKIGMWCNNSETCFNDEVSLRASCPYEMFSKHNILYTTIVYSCHHISGISFRYIGISYTSPH